MSAGNIHIGTSGWSYKHWKGIYYPKEVKPADYLTFYAQQFDVTEINASFYRLPKEETVAQWARQVPPGFRFCPKFSRYLTHMKKLREPEEPLERFFDVFAPMQGMLGPVLLQLPPQLPFRYDLAAYFYELLRRKYAAFDFALEIRHPTWLSDDSLDLMANHRIAFVISHSADAFPYAEMVTAQTVYIRFHGPSALYASAYSEAMLQDFAARMKDWAAAGHEVWAFFNNDIHGYAPADAQRLKMLVADKPQDV